jgi:hypothetical protein
MLLLERQAPTVGTTGAQMVGQIQSTGYQPYGLCQSRVWKMGVGTPALPMQGVETCAGAKKKVVAPSAMKIVDEPLVEDAWARLYSLYADDFLSNDAVDEGKRNDAPLPAGQDAANKKEADLKSGGCVVAGRGESCAQPKPA